MFDSLTPEEVYAILSARIKNTAIGLGAVKGAPCTISSIVKNGKETVVTFQWIGTNGKVQTSTMKLKDGEDGDNGVSPTIKENANNSDTVYKLDITDANGTFTTPNLKSAGSGNNCDVDNCKCIRYTNKDGAANAVGGIQKGETFDNVTLQYVIDRLLSAPYTGPQVAISVSCDSIYAVEDLNSIVMPLVITSKVTKRSNDIQSVKVYVNNVLIDTITAGVANGGTFTTNYNVPITATTTFKVIADDGTSTGTASTTVKVVNSSYVGYVHGGTSVDGDVVKSLTKVVKDKKAYNYDNILMPTDDTYHIIYAYPKEFGPISTIKDGMNFEYIQDYELSEIVIDGCNYYVYKLRTPVCISISGFFQQFT